MYVACSCGHRHWGMHGAAGLLLTDPGRSGVLLQKRSAMVHHGGSWALVGGALEPGETPAEAAVREAVEEEHLDPSRLRVVRSFAGTVHPEWTYTYVLTETERPVQPDLPRHDGWESDGARWFELADVPALDLHSGLAGDWSRVLEQLDAGAR